MMFHLLDFNVIGLNRSGRFVNLEVFSDFISSIRPINIVGIIEMWTFA